MKFNLSYSIVCLLFLSQNTVAQHCPFDGAHIVLIKITDKEHKTDFMLQEINNPMADSCSYAKGLLSLAFKPIDSLYAKNHWFEEYEERYKMQKISTKGAFYVKLGQATRTCMIKEGNNYRYIKRQFIITFKNKMTDTIEQMEIPNDKIFVMCTSAGSWDRFEAIEIK